MNKKYDDDIRELLNDSNTLMPSHVLYIFKWLGYLLVAIIVAAMIEGLVSIMF